LRQLRFAPSWNDCRVSRTLQGTSDIQPSEKGSLEHWLSERYCLYTVHASRIYRAEIHHQPWPLQKAEAEIEINSVAAAAGILLPSSSPLLHFTRKLEVLVWPLQRIS